MVYGNIQDVKEILGIEKDDKIFDNKILKFLQISSEWADQKLNGFEVPNSFRTTISILYAAYLFRTSVFESNTESESAVAVMFKKEAEDLIRTMKFNNTKLLYKVNGEVK